MKSRIKQLFDLGRLYLFPVTFLALMAGMASNSGLTVLNAVKGFFAALLMNFIFFSPNDIFDTESDRNNDRKNTWMGTVAEKKGFPETIAASSIILGYITALITQGLFGIMLAGVTTVSLLYSVPPVRLKTRPPFDSLVNGLGVFMIFSTGVGLTGGNFGDIISGAYWFSLIAVGYHVLLAVPDIEADKKAGIKTTAMYLGWKGAAVLTQGLILISLFFEDWSSLTRNFLLIQFSGLFLLWSKNVRDRINFEENLSKFVFLGLVLLIAYLGYYSVSRGLV